MRVPLTQGPRAGSNWPAEGDTYDDPASGATVRRLTGYPGAADLHPYFTEPCLYDDGRRMVLSSDRTGTTQAFSVDLETGLLTQLTDLPEAEPRSSSDRPAIADHDAEAVYCWRGHRMVQVTLDTLAVTPLYEKPAGYVGKIPGVSADGEHVLVSIVEEVRDRTGDDWMREKFELGPHSQVLAVPTDGSGDVEVLVDEETWIGHVNPSPTRPELLTYCEEGPWGDVDNRIWVLDREAGETWAVRDVPEDGGVGHEYWMQDGERVGYHGWEVVDGESRSFAGSAHYTDTDHVETEIPVRGTHTHARSLDWLVVDGSRSVPHSLLYRYDHDAGEYEGPRVLATHDWGRGGPDPHSHLLPGEERVAFDSARYDGSADAHVAEIPDWEGLPAYDG